MIIHRITAEVIGKVRAEEFLPAMRRLSLLGLLLIKFSAPPQWFSRVVDLLVEVFESSRLLARAQSRNQAESSVRSLSEHTSYSVPALEALLAAYVFAAYALTRRSKYEYLRTLFPRTVSDIGGPDDAPSKGFLLFWPLTYGWGAPDVRRDLLLVERFSNGDMIESLMGGTNLMKAAALQVDCLIDWHSVLASRHQGEPETHQFFVTHYPDVNNHYAHNFTRENLQNIVPLVRKLWDSIQAGNGQMFLDSGLPEVFNGLALERRKEILGKFLIYAERDHGERMWGQQRFPFLVHWEPTELNAIVNQIKNR